MEQRGLQFNKKGITLIALVITIIVGMNMVQEQKTKGGQI